MKIKNESKIRTSINVYDYLSEYLDGGEAKFQMYDFGDDIYTEYDLKQEATKEYPRKDVTLNIGNTMTDSDGNILPSMEFYTTIPAGRELEVVFTATAREVEEPTVVSNYVTVSGKYIHTAVSPFHSPHSRSNRLFLFPRSDKKPVLHLCCTDSPIPVPPG